MIPRSRRDFPHPPSLPSCLILFSKAPTKKEGRENLVDKTTVKITYYSNDKDVCVIPSVTLGIVMKMKRN